MINLNFKTWLEAIVPFELTRKIRRGLKRNYKQGKSAKKYTPGTFGIEIEFRATRDQDEIRNKLYNHPRVTRDFNDDHAPPRPDDWIDDNPEPEQLKWSDDLVTNYKNVYGFNRATTKDDLNSFEELKEPVEIPQIIYDAADRSPSYKELIVSLARGFYFQSAPSNEKEFETLYYQMNNGLKYVSKNFKDSDQIYKVGLELLNRLFDFHRNRMKLLDKKSFEEDAEKEHEEEYAKWQSEYKTIKDNWQKFEDDKDELFEKFVDNIINFGREDEYISGGMSSVGEKISEYIDFIKSIGMEAREGTALETMWGIGEDEADVVEVRTPILTTKDIPNLIKVLKKLSKEPRDGSTSAHVHIGMPETTDAFDLIAMATLADEENIKKDAGENRNFSSYAKMNQVTYDKLYSSLPKGIHTNADILRVLKFNTDKHRGTNLKSFFNIGTVEYRYLSSQILDNIPRFIQWIQYYLMTPKIAQGRTQITLKMSSYDPQTSEGKIIITRLPRGMIKIDKDVKSSPATNSPVQYLRKEYPFENNFKFKIAERNLLKETISLLIDLFNSNLWTDKIISYNKQIPLNQFLHEKISTIWNFFNKQEKQEILTQYMHHVGN